ncbi:hypothetical protein ABK040_014076 [Willaertia magna]
MTKVEVPVKVVNQVFKDVIKRRNAQALKFVPKELQDAYIEHWAKWTHDNVPAPDQVIDKEWVSKKYNISTKPVPANASHVKLVSPFGNPEESRMRDLIKYESELQKVWKITKEDHENILDAHSLFRNARRISVWSYNLAIILGVPIGILLVVLKNTSLSNKLQGTVFGKKKTDKKEWDDVPVETVWDHNSKVTVKSA